jgi:hypothetical protein
LDQTTPLISFGWGDENGPTSLVGYYFTDIQLDAAKGK